MSVLAKAQKALSLNELLTEIQNSRQLLKRLDKWIKNDMQELEWWACPGILWRCYFLMTKLKGCRGVEGRNNVDSTNTM
jgi:hypothetical protein